MVQTPGTLCVTRHHMSPQPRVYRSPMVQVHRSCSCTSSNLTNLNDRVVAPHQMGQCPRRLDDGRPVDQMRWDPSVLPNVSSDAERFQLPLPSHFLFGGASLRSSNFNGQRHTNTSLADQKLTSQLKIILPAGQVGGVPARFPLSHRNCVDGPGKGRRCSEAIHCNLLNGTHWTLPYGPIHCSRLSAVHR